MNPKKTAPMKKHLSLIFFFAALASTKAQNDFSFYHMGDYVTQTQNLSPVYLPKNSFTFGTAANIGGSVHSNLLLSDVWVSDGNALRIDFDRLNAVAQEENTFNADLSTSLLMLSLKTRKGSISLFANIRSTVNWTFGKDFTRIGAQGFSDSFALSNDKIAVTAYSEVGIGFTRTFLDNRLAVGLRLKALHGFSHGQTKEKAAFSIDIDPLTSAWNVQASNATIQTSGLALAEDELLLFTDNKGFGMDIGATYAATDKLTLELAVNDIGSIHWTQDVRNYILEDTAGSSFHGANLNAEGSIEEELEAALNEVIGTQETTASFKSQLATRTFVSARYQLSPKNALVAAFFKNSPSLVTQTPSYSLGYQRTLQKTTYGILARTGSAQENIYIGANAMLRLGFFQLYAATDNVASLFGKVEEVHGGSLRFGLNVVFGYKKWLPKE